MANRLSYDDELARLPETYARMRCWDHRPLLTALNGVASGPAIFVGTGGTLPVARLAAQLHEVVSGQLARVVTPLELAQLPHSLRVGAVLFSAGAKHPDALNAISRLGHGRLAPGVVVSLRSGDELAELTPPDVIAVALPPLPFAEGFLATNSVLTMMVSIVAAYGGGASLPNDLPSMDPGDLHQCENLLVLTTPSLTPAAMDVETRFNELGLAAAQVNDYRNFAHGRHVALHRRAAATAVLGLVSPPFEELSRRTLDLLPASIPRLVWQGNHDWPLSAIEMMTASARLAGDVAAAQKVNPSRPGAAPFGRSLYHLAQKSLLPTPDEGPIQRKLVALGVGSADADERHRYDVSFAEWREVMSSATFGGLVLDYDGTVCTTAGRYELPDDRIRQEILRLLDGGVLLGFASGRGKSLHSDLRKWVPDAQWHRVRLGLYNGGVLLGLQDEVPDASKPSPLMADVLSRLDGTPFWPAIACDARSVQVSLTLAPNAFARSGTLRDLVAERLQAAPPLPVRVIASGHSIDIVPDGSTKVAVADWLATDCGLPVLAVGDQGGWGGNDFELLARSPYTLTVDRCSSDPTRCWYLDYQGRTGPGLLLAYLRALRLSGTSCRLDWPDEV